MSPLAPSQAKYHWYIKQDGPENDGMLILNYFASPGSLFPTLLTDTKNQKIKKSTQKCKQKQHKAQKGFFIIKSITQEGSSP